MAATSLRRLIQAIVAAVVFAPATYAWAEPAYDCPLPDFTPVYGPLSSEPEADLTPRRTLDLDAHGTLPPELKAELIDVVEQRPDEQHHEIREQFYTALDHMIHDRPTDRQVRTIRRQARRGDAFAMTRYALLAGWGAAPRGGESEHLVWYYRALLRDPVHSYAMLTLASTLDDDMWGREPEALVASANHLCIAGDPEACWVAARHGLMGTAQPVPVACTLAQAELGHAGMGGNTFSSYVLAQALLLGGDWPSDRDRVLSLLDRVTHVDPDWLLTLRLFARVRAAEAPEAQPLIEQLWELDLQADRPSLRIWFPRVHSDANVALPIPGDPLPLMQKVVELAAQGSRPAARVLLSCAAGGQWCSDLVGPEHREAWSWLVEDHDPVLQAQARSLLAHAMEQEASGSAEEQAGMLELLRESAESGDPSSMLYLGTRLFEAAESDQVHLALAWFAAGKAAAFVHGQPTLPTPFDPSSPHHAALQERYLKVEQALSQADRGQLDAAMSEIRGAHQGAWREMSPWLDSYRAVFGD